jgi:uncharacterized phage-associated protein
MNSLPYIKYSSDQLGKIGYTVVYLADRISGLSKTKLLKLLYILDEISIKKSGVPILNLKYKVWKFGPVSEELFIDLSSESTLLEKYISRDGEGNYIVSKVDFDQDEFSESDIELMDYVIDKYGSKTVTELISYTHRVNSPWYLTAKENSVLELLESETINNTEFVIDMSQIIAHDKQKLDIYLDYIESH